MNSVLVCQFYGKMGLEIGPFFRFISDVIGDRCCYGDRFFVIEMASYP